MTRCSRRRATVVPLYDDRETGELAWRAGLARARERLDGSQTSHNGVFFFVWQYWAGRRKGKLVAGVGGRVGGEKAATGSGGRRRVWIGGNRGRADVR